MTYAFELAVERIGGAPLDGGFETWQMRRGHELEPEARINIDPSGVQVMINWKNGKQILSRAVSDALCDIAHRWTIYIAGICVRQDGAQYIKSIDITPDGVHMVERLSDVLEHFYEEVKADCNANHLVGMGWLAVPGNTRVTEAQLSSLLASVGAWNQVKVAA
ncbi:hypothetical protein QZH45_14320 [Pseudomonas corrugata]|uniref:hypothetical protein n=1 Tax=Pseudomonas corrugata TaxID=47879 RepID=UPI0006D8C17D|nr:hypothetical protein [Pseudomonas corrugata]AOE60405.1 hypothetical protein AXG94_00955 [Pseudomonas corrugata]